jgi:hypothetical protein
MRSRVARNGFFALGERQIGATIEVDKAPVVTRRPAPAYSNGEDDDAAFEATEATETEPEPEEETPPPRRGPGRPPKAPAVTSPTQPRTRATRFTPDDME